LTTARSICCSVSSLYPCRNAASREKSTRWVVAPAAALTFQGNNITYTGAFLAQNITVGAHLTFLRSPFPNWTETPSTPGPFTGMLRFATAAAATPVIDTTEAGTSTTDETDDAGETEEPEEPTAGSDTPKRAPRPRTAAKKKKR